MSSAEYEWYLRRRCEDELIERRDLAVRTRAQALTAIGVLEEKVADAVLAAYARAHRIRNDDRYEDHSTTYMSPLPGDVTVRRCSARITEPWGSVTTRSLVTSADESSMDVAVTITDQSIDDPFRHTFARQPQQITVRDDRRKVHEVHFSGGGDDTHLSGHLTMSPALRADTAWITLFGQRIELTAPPDDVTVEIVEPSNDLTVDERAARYLARCLAGDSAAMRHRFGDDDTVQTVFDTYLESGLLTAGSPVLQAYPGVAELFVDKAGQPAHRQRFWPAMAPDDDAGLARSRLLAVTTPEFDGIRVTLITLTADDQSFRISLRAGGPGTARSPRSGLPFTVAAEDDRGNHYAGEPGSWGSSNAGIEGTVEFRSALDTRASTLNVRLSMPVSDAVVHVPLVWDAE